MLYFATGVSYPYPGVDQTAFSHPVQAVDEGEAHKKVLAYFAAKGLEVSDLKIHEMIG